ncbi:STAS/SEC14 domain-containing protein [Luteolibacter sp. Populi]|uniref:STAS/SEC14 domain-containing protein n=1 Tax=Luteolibacter sp. Populi TaxID=3230487 RepID=UPI0034663C16
MNVQILDAINGVITVEITGKLNPDELAANQKEVLAQLREWGSGSILCICENFEGWTGGDWSDLSFQLEADPLIRKMAVIGEREWEELAMAFAASGVRPFPIAFFDSDHLVEARVWLQG